MTEPEPSPTEAPLPSERVALLRALSGLSVVAAVVAAALLLAAIGLVATDMLWRNLLNRSIAGTTEMSSWLMAAIGWLALSYTLRCDGHIQVRILADRLPPRARHGLSVVISTLALGFMAVLVWAMFDRWEYFRDTGQTGVETGYPTWWLYTVVLTGAALFALQFAVRLIDDVARWHRARHYSVGAS
ncbi:TRAP transporter small permease [Egibacter rhizosphaerae]|uniref:TRAP transporter small permease n=1 Tax=Egibacter rhizosphaerae TaxID=1670831 RepID=A0A411YGW1_9ACTN|nr:TRAP transporter small permease [Egibacter rhizosphaerae]QBI20427.1 TRAP transporter small permease [Egibacter rhizosphaerae]